MAPEVGLVGVRVFDVDVDVDNRQSDAVLGSSNTSGSLSSTKKQDTELYSSRSIRDDTPRGLDYGTTNGSIAAVSGFEGKDVNRKMGKLPRNGGGSYRRLKLLQADTVLPSAENDSANMESEMLGSHFSTCSNADKFQTVKQRNNLNGRRGDRRNSKIPVKSSVDSFSLKAGVRSFSQFPGGGNAFGTYGLKPDVHDVSKLMEEISLDELLDGTVKCATFGKDKEKKRTTNVKDNVLDSVRKVCSLIFLQKTQQGQQSDEAENDSLSTSPADNNVENGSDGDQSAVADIPQCDKDLEPCSKGETSTELNDIPICRPRDILEKLTLPPPKDLESLLQDAVEPAASMKLTDSRFTKQSPHGISLPSFPWSHNFNGHHKSSNDALKTSNKSTCYGRCVRISHAASFTGRSADDLTVDLDSFTYDDSLVPAGQLKYRLPKVGNSSNTVISQRLCQEEASALACPPASLPPPALHSSKVLSAARTLFDMASSSKHNSGELLKWPKRPSQKVKKSRKSRLIGIPEEEFPTPKSGTILPSHVVKGVEYGPSSKKPKISPVGRREDCGPVQAVIGLSSPPIPKSNRSSPGRLARDSVSEAKHLNGSFARSSFMVPPPPRSLDRSNQNLHKSRKLAPMDWNRTRN